MNLLSMTDEAAIMRQMPPIPVKLNHELAAAIINSGHSFSDNTNSNGTRNGNHGTDVALNGSVNHQAHLSQQHLGTYNMADQSQYMYQQ